MKSFLELLGRFIIGFTNVILLVLGQSHFKNLFPLLAPYSVYIMYTSIIILGLWIINPVIDFLYGYSHKHKKIMR